MDVFNKVMSQVSSSVHSTVSQLQGVLPGNPVTREFESSAHTASAGPGLLWKIYKGNKRSTKQEASIFVFEKRQLDRYNKNDRELILETLRRGVVQLTKIRHPKILTMQHPLEESRDSLAFATEPVFASLANVLGQTTNMPQPANMSDYKLFDIEIKYGLLQISEGLTFLHNDVKLLHKNISPESIIINTQGAWKIFCFDFCVLNTNPANMPPSYPFEGYSPTVPPVCQPNLDFLAPECIISSVHSTASDMFSLGMLAYNLYSPDKKCFKSARDLQQFKPRVQELKKLNAGKMQFIHEELQEFVKLLLNVTPEIRPDAHQFIKIPFFDDIGVKTLTYLDSVLQWDNLQKSQFYKGLPEALTKLPHRVKIQRVVACLSHDLGQPAMVPFVLPSLLDIAQDCDEKEFCARVLPLLKPLMTLLEPVQVLLIFLQRMELLLKLTPAGDIQRHVLPMLYRGLDADSPQIHELCLAVLPTFAGLLDHANVKNSLLPRIKKLCLNTSTLSVRVNCLLCVGRLLEHLDKWLVLDEVLPFLPQIPSREPAVLMGILGIYKLAMNHKKLGITKEIIASRVLPFLIPLCIENGLSVAQFNALTALVKEMFRIVETEHRTKLEQLNGVKDERKALADAMPTVAHKSKPVELDAAFSGLGLDSFVPGMGAPKKAESAAKSSLLDDWVVTDKSTPNSSNQTMSNPALSNQTVLNPSSNNQTMFNSTLNNQTVLNPSPNNQVTYNNNSRSNQMALNPSPGIQTMFNNSRSNQTVFSHSPSNRTMFHSSLSNQATFNNALSNQATFNNALSNQIGSNNNQFSLSNSQWSQNGSGTQNYSPFVGGSNNNQNVVDGGQWGMGQGAGARDWSAFDKLLPNSGGEGSNRVSMNAMGAHGVPLIPSSSGGYNNGGKGLSNDDIMDLLS